MSARRCALQALAEWQDTSRYAADLLDETARRLRLSPPDRGLAQDLLYGVVRNLHLLDELVERFRRGSIKSQTQDLLRLGLYQLFLSDIPEHAAVHETVALARPHERGLVNAILREAQRQRPALLAEIETWPPEDRYSHPDFLVRRWTAQYGAEAAAALCRWNNEPPPVYARINPLARDRAALERVAGETEPSLLGPEHPGFFRVEGAPDPEWLRAGLVYVQDPSTALACRLLAPRPGERVLDACAAPGGKTSLLAATMENRGVLVASDASGARLEPLRENLKRLGVDSAEVRRIDWTAPGEEDLAEPYDAILLDAPCSNTGTMRRRIDVRWRLQDRDFARQAETQARLLAGLAKALKPGGRLVYSTCSLDQAENEEIVSASGLALERSVSCLPWRDGYDGAFAALLRL